MYTECVMRRLTKSALRWVISKLIETMALRSHALEILLRDLIQPSMIIAYTERTLDNGTSMAVAIGQVLSSIIELTEVIWCPRVY
jgi:hypothetical protein